MKTPSKCRACGSSDLIWFIFRNKGGAQGEPLRMPEIAYDFILVCKECSESLRVLRADDVVEYLTQLLTLPAQQGEGAAFEQKPLEVVGYASPGQIEIVRKVPRTGGMKVKGCKDDRYTEPVVLLSDARRAMISLAARCQQEGAFKTCLECGYQDGHDEICQFHARNRKLQPAEQGVPDDVFEEGQWWLAELDSIVANGTPAQKRAMAVVRNLLSCWQRTQAAAVPVGWQFYQDGKWWNGDDRVKDHRANTEAAGVPVRDVYAAPAQPAVQGEQQPVGEMISNDGDIYWADRHPPMGTKLYAAPIAQTAQSEVQRLREALEGMLEYFPEGASDGECFAVDAARAALAVSTGQGV